MFSDTAVFNYNWITATWYALPNTGLPRAFNKPVVRMLTVYGDSGSSSNSSLFALSDTAIYLYNWFYQQWFSIPNNGLHNAVYEAPMAPATNSPGFPNPFNGYISFVTNATLAPNEIIHVTVFNEAGTLWQTYQQTCSGTEITILLPGSENWPLGLYFFEIKAGKFFKTIRAIRK